MGPGSSASHAGRPAPLKLTHQRGQPCNAAALMAWIWLQQLRRWQSWPGISIDVINAHARISVALCSGLLQRCGGAHRFSMEQAALAHSHAISRLLDMQARRSSVVVRADYLGSTTNQVRHGLPEENIMPACMVISKLWVYRALRARKHCLRCLIAPRRALPPNLFCMQIMVLSTFLPLVAGRFGLAPTSTRHTNAGVKLLPQDKAAGLYSNDPAGESWWKCCVSPYTCWAAHDNSMVQGQHRGWRPGRQASCIAPQQLLVIRPHAAGFNAVDVLALGAVSLGTCAAGLARWSVSRIASLIFLVAHVLISSFPATPLVGRPQLGHVIGVGIVLGLKGTGEWVL